MQSKDSVVQVENAINTKHSCRVSGIRTQIMSDDCRQRTVPKS